jgi:hypothetical protein
MDQESERIWLAYVQAEQAYREAMGELRHIDMVTALRAGLTNLPWRRAALAALRASDVGLSEALLAELFGLATAAHAQLRAVRECIVRVPRDVLEVRLDPLVRQLIAEPGADYEAYRRIAELLRELEFWPLLAALTDAAAASGDADIREVAEDFGRGSPDDH